MRSTFSSHFILQVCIVVFLVVAAPHLASAEYTYYPFFESGTYEALQTDGANATGVMCRPGGSMAVLSMDNIVISDMCGGGSAIRAINASGIHMIAGSYTDLGYVDGNATAARFEGYAQGSRLVNGVCAVNGTIYLADSRNNVIRAIDASTGETSTFISQSSKLSGTPLNRPTFVAPYSRSSTVVDLFVSDTANQRILFTPIQTTVTPPLTLVKDGFQSGAMSVSDNLTSLYFISNTDVINGLLLEQNTEWEIGDASCTGYSSSLYFSPYSNELYFFGEQDSVLGIYTLSASSTASTSTSCGTLLFEWPYDSMIRSFGFRNNYSYYALTDSSLYIVSTKNLIFPPLDALDGRVHVRVGYPTVALPLDDACYMSEFFASLRADYTDAVAKANASATYYTQFAPIDDVTLLVENTVNVSDWCDMINPDDFILGSSGGILVLDFYGPVGWSYSKVRSTFVGSALTNTKATLADFKANGITNANGDELGTFCLLACEGDECLTATTTTCASKPDNGGDGCDGVCVGGIVSAVVMGVTLTILVVLAFLSPANIFNAVFMVPII